MDVRGDSTGFAFSFFGQQMLMVFVMLWVGLLVCSRSSAACADLLFSLIWIINVFVLILISASWPMWQSQVGILVYIIQHLYNMESRISPGLIWLLWMSRRLRGVAKEWCILWLHIDWIPVSRSTLMHWRIVCGAESFEILLNISREKWWTLPFSHFGTQPWSVISCSLM